MKVLLVDDDLDVRSLLKMLLMSQGHEITECSNGMSALQTYQEDSFPLLIVDWELGDIDGIQLCRQIRELPNGDECVIMMFTGRSSSEDLQRILDSGADDYLQKPVDIKWLKIRLKISVSQAENKAARKLAERQLAAARMKEIDIGSRIQKNLLLGTPPEHYAGIDIVAHSIPSQKVDGDFYDFYCHDDHCFDLVIGDVMGKGIPAALLGSAVKSQILHAIQELKTQTLGKPPALSRIMKLVQMKVTQHLIELEKFVTLCYARFYLEEKKIELVNCGHMRTIHYRSADRVCELIPGENLPLGVIYEEEFIETVVSLAERDLVLFYSDGITDVRSESGEFFGENNLVHYVTNQIDLPLDQFIDSLCRRVILFSKKGSTYDDQTCVAVRIDPAMQPEIATGLIEITSELSELGKIRQFVRSFLDSFARDASLKINSNPILLAINEAVSNVIRHAYDTQPGHSIQLRAKANRKRLEFQIQHDGKSFTPPRLDPSRLDSPGEGGLGLYIIDEIMDEVNYICLEDGIRVIRMIQYVE